MLRAVFLEVTDQRTWPESQEVNQKFAEDFMRQFSWNWQLRGFAVDLGVFTNPKDEKLILGTAWQPAGLNLSLWYSHFDGKEVGVRWRLFSSIDNGGWGSSKNGADFDVTSQLKINFGSHSDYMKWPIWQAPTFILRIPALTLPELDRFPFSKNYRYQTPIFVQSYWPCASCNKKLGR